MQWNFSCRTLKKSRTDDHGIEKCTLSQKQGKVLVKSLSIVALLYTDKSRFSCCYSPIVAPPKFRKRRPKSSWNCSHYKEHEQTPLIHPNKVIHGVPLEQTFIFSLNNTSIEVMFGRTQLSIQGGKQTPLSLLMLVI